MKRFESVQIGDCTLYLGDCLEILPTLGKVDAVVTDPPYGIGESYDSFVDTKANAVFLARRMVAISFRMAERTIITPSNGLQYNYPEPTWTLAWVTPAGAGSGPWGFSCWQPVLCYGKDPFLQNGLGRAADIFIHTESSEVNGHPCPKPERFMQRLVARTTVDRDVICDPFMGSGTTGVACVKLGRKFIGIEIEPKYFDIACRRIEKAVSEPRLQLPEPKPKQDRMVFDEAPQ